MQVGCLERSAISTSSNPARREKLWVCDRDRALLERGDRRDHHECTDQGRSINQQEVGWETTLTGIPKEIYEFWKRRLRDLGYKLKVQIIDFPGGMPGDVGMTLTWK